jgi:hypothetical protein
MRGTLVYNVVFDGNWLALRKRIRVFQIPAGYVLKSSVLLYLEEK